MTSNLAKKALLIIDMQKGSFTEKTPRHDTHGVVSRINGLAQKCRQIGAPVIFIQHDGSAGNAFVPESDDWELLSELEVKPEDKIVSKTANDAFYNSKLQNELNEANVTELLITGCATDFCVESTIQSALTKEYVVTVVEDCHTTGQRPELSAKQVIDHYNWIWQNMIPTKGLVQVLSSSEIDFLETTIIQPIDSL